MQKNLEKKYTVYLKIKKNVSPIMYKSTKEYEYPCHLRFIDSNKFMLGSLDSHLNNLSEMYSCNCSTKSNQQIKIRYDDKNIYTRCKSCTKRSKQSIDLLKLKVKTALDNNYDKRIQSFAGIHTYPYGIDKDLINKLEAEIRNKPIQLNY